MLTRNHILIRRPKDEVFDAALKTLKEMGAKIKKEDKSGYYIQSKTTSWNRITGSKLEIFVWDDLDDSILDVYDHSPEAYAKKSGGVADERFLKRFFEVLPKYIPYNTKYGIEVVKEVVKQRNPSLMCTVCNRDVFAYTFQNGTVRMCNHVWCKIWKHLVIRYKCRVLWRS
jgi:hypothetical protein